MNDRNNFATGFYSEHSYFFRMLGKVKRGGYRLGDLFTMKVDDLRKINGLTAYNILIIMKMQEMYKEARLNEQRKCRI